MRYLFALLISNICMVHECRSQSNGILPLTGIRYFKEGVWGKSIETKADGAYLLSNRIPLNKEIEIKLVSPEGFTGKNKVFFAGIEIGIYSMKGDALFKITNTLKEKEATGIPANSFKELSAKFTLKPEIVKDGQTCIVKLRFFDLKSSSQLKLEFPITIARPGEALQLAKTITLINPGEGIMAASSAVRMKSIAVTIDTSIRVNPKMAYISLAMDKIEGSGTSEILAGKEAFWIYNDKLEEIKMTDRLLKQVSGSMEDNVVNYLSKIPYRSKAMTSGTYIIRFRWESPDKRKIIDVVIIK